MNASSITALDYVKIIQRLQQAGAIGKLSLLRFYLYTGTKNDIFLVFGKSFVGCIYLLFPTLMMVVFKRKQMVGLVQVVLFMTNVVEIAPWVLSLPFNIMFCFFSKIDVPIPYPWCIIYYILQDPLPSTMHLLSLNLKILLAVNRLCSVAYPFQTTTWFSKSRCTAYCAVICTICTSFGLVINYQMFQIEKQKTLFDIWEEGKYELYSACRLDSVTFVGTEFTISISFILDTLGYSVLIVTTLLLFSMNLVIIVKIKRLERQRKALSEMPKNIFKRNSNRVQLLNRITVWILTVVIVIELPLLCLKSVGFYEVVYAMIQRNTEHLNVGQGKSASLLQIWFLVYTLLVPLDMVIFTALSKKARQGLREFLCSDSCLEKFDSFT